MLTFYCAIYAALLWSAGGYPYGVDNNESYSSWWHARSLYENGIAHTRGLTDEVFAHHPGASPYVHSHQGNFPRLYTFVWYALGFRSMESLLCISTFTVGLAAIWLAFRFLSALVRPGFAAAGCLVMMTNYLLFAQWQVSLYNVWHAFFFFSSLRCIQTLGATPRPGRWFILCTANFAALFYWEYVFTAFLTVLCALYATGLYWRRLRRLLLAASAVAAGAAFAAGLLLAQLTAYMGWANVKEDVRLTLTARNTAADPQMLEQVTSFYREHRIIFWHNFFDAAPLRTPDAFWDSLLRYHLGYYSTPLVVVTVLALFGWLLGWGRRQLPGLGSRLGSGLAMGIYLLALLPGLPALRDSLAPAHDIAVGGWPWGHPLATALVTCAAGLGLILAGRGPGPCAPAGRVLLLGLGAALAYAFTYRLFTGYVYSGYLHRLVPMLVFVTDLLLALPLWLAWQQACELMPLSRAPGRKAVSLGALGAFVVLSALIAGAAGQWFLMQSAALRLVRPDSFAFLRLLDQPPFHGRSLVSNTYPAPMAARTGSWGYADPSIFAGRLTLSPDGFQIERDLKYLWFADRDRNPDYLRPDLAVFLAHSPNVEEARQREIERLEREQAGLTRTPPAGLVRRARSAFQPFVQHRLLHTDELRLDIVDLDWDFPPFLRRHDAEILALARQLDLRQKLARNEDADAARRRWRVEWRWAETASPPPDSAPPAPIVWCDDRPVRVDDPTAGVLVTHGDHLRLQIPRHRDGGQLQVFVNNTGETFDLAALPESGLTFEWRASSPFGRFTRVPAFSAGFHVRSTTGIEADGPVAFVSYRYAHQDGAPEANTVVRLYAESADKQWRLADTVHLLGPAAVPVRLRAFRQANPDTIAEHAASRARGDSRSYAEWLGGHLAAHPQEWSRPGIVPGARLERSRHDPAEATLRLPLPAGLPAQIQFSVSPGTTTKSGLEYFGLTLAVPGADAAAPTASSPPTPTVDAPLPYGRLHLRLKFPANRWPQSEPLITTGENEAGDILYVIYHDEHHIRIGLDHWFKGGPLTAPIPVDFTREYDLEISLGSLFPSVESLVFADQPAATVTAFKQRVLVRLDGATVIDSVSEFYESDPVQVRVGRNDIRATSCGPRFTGEIRSVERRWPESP